MECSRLYITVIHLFFSVRACLVCMVLAIVHNVLLIKVINVSIMNILHAC